MPLHLAPDLLNMALLTGAASLLFYGLRYHRADIEREQLRAEAHAAARERKRREQLPHRS